MARLPRFLLVLPLVLEMNACSEGAQPDRARQSEAPATEAKAVVEPAGIAASLSGSTHARLQQLILPNGRLWLDGCTVKYASQGRTTSVPTELIPPCVVSVDFDGRPAVIHTEWGGFLLIVSSREKSQQPDASTGRECDTVVQGILIAEDGVFASLPMGSFAACGPGPFDKKLYEALAAQAHKGAQSDH
jgi:hypothetical protein